MTVYTKITIEGTEYNPDDINLERSIGEYNAVSNFKVTFNNYAGQHDDTFSLNDEVKIYADLDTDPATTLLFTGIIESIDYSGSGNSERLTIIGRDYGAVLMDMSIQPVVYKNTDCGAIVKSVVEQNAQGLVGVANVDTATGTILEKLAFNHNPIFDAIKQIAELCGYIFYVDENKVLNFVEKDSVSSGLTFDNTNITKADFKIDDSKVFNKIWVYGDRILTGATDTGGIGDGGSVFPLNDYAYNSRVFVDSVLQEPGGVYQMDNPSTDNVKYLVNFTDKQIVFTSGTTAGDNIPASGTSNIQVDYERNTPILKYKQDADSIGAYGPKTKVITDTDIKDYSQANDKAAAVLNENKDPKIQGDIDLYGVVDVTPGNTCIVNIPFQNVNNQTYKILNADYRFTPENCLSNQVLHLTLNLKINDFTDTLKDTVLRIKKAETGALQQALTRLETSTDTIPIDSRYEVWELNVNDNFVFHSGKHGKLDDPNSRLGTGNLGSTFYTSGGYTA